MTSFLSLIKIRITLSVGFIAATGWYVAHRGWGNPFDLIMMLILTLMVCAGVCTLNHVVEWKSDSLMHRTRNRPIPNGDVSLYFALVFGVLLTLIGLVLMGIFIGSGMVVGASLSGAIYILIYTPLKKVSWLNTTVGAIPGALPIMGGWYAARGELGMEGWVLLAVMFFWQHPHFYAIAWICRKDYKQAGYQMLGKDDPSGNILFGHSLLHTVFLILFTGGLLFTDFSAGWVYLISVSVINLIFGILVFNAYRVLMEGKNKAAQKVLLFSVWYQILFFVFILSDTLIRVTIF